MHIDQTTPKTPSKRARPAHVAPRQAAIDWPHALRVVAPLETRQRVLDDVKAAGFPPTSWGTPASLRALADALTAAEDWLELEPSNPRRERERAALRALRRALEAEVCP